MVSGGGMTCVKIMMIIFNFLFWLAGLTLIVIGSISQNESTKAHIVNPAAVFIIVIGVVIFVLAFLGCCGAWKESRCMLITFGILMIIILILAVAATILAFIFKAKARDLWVKSMQESIKTYDSSKPDAFIFNWDQLQKDEKCCGVVNFTDWSTNPKYPGGSLPSSCCNDSVTSNPCKAVSPYSKQQLTGCADTVVSAIEYKFLIVGGIVLGVVVLMIIGIVFAFCLAQAIHKDYNVV